MHCIDSEKAKVLSSQSFSEYLGESQKDTWINKIEFPIFSLKYLLQEWNVDRV